MIIEDYVSFEVAKLLKEKGFDECIFEFYEGNKIKYAHNGKGFRLSELGSDIYYPHITHQMAMKWLREVHNRFIEVCADKGHDFKSIVFRPAVYDKDLDCLWESDNYKSYEIAVEAALKYALENLI